MKPPFEVKIVIGVLILTAAFLLLYVAISLPWVFIIGYEFPPWGYSVTAAFVTGLALFWFSIGLFKARSYAFRGVLVIVTVAATVSIGYAMTRTGAIVYPSVIAPLCVIVFICLMRSRHYFSDTYGTTGSERNT